METTQKKNSNTFLSRKPTKILVIILLILLAIILPAAAFFSLTQRGSGTATLAMSPTTQSVNPGNQVAMDINLDPASNSVSFVNLEITYDAAKFTNPSLTANTTAFSQILDGPINTCTGNTCSIILSLGIGSDPSKVITIATKVATLTLQAADGTGGLPTQIAFGTKTQILSTSATSGANDNVLGTTTPADITISGNPTITPSPSPSTTPTDTPTQTPTVTPTITTTLTPAVTCIPRPPCLDAVPRCLVPEPKDGWCPPTTTPSPLPTSHPSQKPTPKISGCSPDESLRMVKLGGDAKDSEDCIRQKDKDNGNKNASGSGTGDNDKHTGQKKKQEWFIDKIIKWLEGLGFHLTKN